MPRVEFNGADTPVVEWLGIALEPNTSYNHVDHGGGSEDVRMNFIEPLQRYAVGRMALSFLGPRTLLAIREERRSTTKTQRIGAKNE